MLSKLRKEDAELGARHRKLQELEDALLLPHVGKEFEPSMLGNRKEWQAWRRHYEKTKNRPLDRGEARKAFEEKMRDRGRIDFHARVIC